MTRFLSAALLCAATAASASPDCLYPPKAKQPDRCLTATGAAAGAANCAYCRADSDDAPPVVAVNADQGIDFKALTSCMSVTVILTRHGEAGPRKVGGHFHMTGRASRKERTNVHTGEMATSASKTLSVMKTKIGEQTGWTPHNIILAGVDMLWQPTLSPRTDMKQHLLDDHHDEACAYVRTQLGLAATLPCAVTTFEMSGHTTIDAAGALHH